MSKFIRNFLYQQISFYGLSDFMRSFMFCRIERISELFIFRVEALKDQSFFPNL